MTYCYELIEGIAILGAFDIVEVLVILIFKIFNTLVIIYFNYLVIYLFILYHKKGCFYTQTPLLITKKRFQTFNTS